MHGWAEEAIRQAIDVLARSSRNDLATDLNRILGAIDFDDLDVLRCPGSECIADEILEAQSFSEIVGLLGRLSDVLGVSHTTLHVISEAPSTNFTTRVLTTYPKEWIERYVDRRYFLLDPVGRICLKADHGFFWSEIDRSAPSLITFWADAAAHGVGPSGYTIPITTERGDKLAISVCSGEEEEPFRDRVHHCESDIFSLSIFLSDAFCRLASENRPNSFNPTDDQLTILRAVAMGVDEAELAAQNYHYGSYKTLQRSICALFCTKTVAQAAVLAARIGLLAEAPLTRADVLAASERGAARPVVVTSPNGISLRRLARMRNATSPALPE